MSATAYVVKREKPSGKQVYRLCRAALTALQLEFPETGQDASNLIAQLDAIADKAPAAATGTDDIPF